MMKAIVLLVWHQDPDPSKTLNPKGIEMTLFRSTGIFAITFCATVSAHAQFRPSITILKEHVLSRINLDGTSIDWVELVRRAETPRGVDAIGETQLHFNESMSNVEVLEAWTLTADGKRLEVKADQIRVMSGKGDGDREFGDSKTKVIIFPAVTPGSVVGYRAKYTSHKPIYVGQYETRFQFSPHIRYEDVKLRFEAPTELPLRFGIRTLTGWPQPQGGPARPNDQTPQGWKAHEFTYRSTDVVPPESSRVDLADFAPSVSASTFPNYAALGRAYTDRATPMAQVTPDLVQLAQSLTVGLTDERSKVNALYQWVSKNIRYVSVAIGTGGWVPHPAAQVLEHRYGDCKDHVVLLQAMLSAVGIQSTGALVNSGKTYRLPELASSDPFNHIITYVPSLKLFMDSTAELAPMGILPFVIMGKPALLVETGEVLTTPATSPATERTISHTALKLRRDGHVEGTNVTTRFGQHELESRGTHIKNKDREQTQVVNQWLQRFAETGTGAITSPDPKDLNAKWEIKSQFLLDPMANVPGPSAMTIPVGLAPGELRELLTERPMTNRRFESICDSMHIVEETDIEFPSTVRLQRVPPAVSYKTLNLRYEAHYRLQAKTLKVRRELWLKNERIVCNAEDDAQWGKFLPVLQRDLRGQIFFR